MTTPTGADQTRLYDRRERAFEKLYDAAEEMADEFTPETDMSLRDLLNKVGWNKASDDLDNLVEWDHLDAESASAPEVASALENMNDATFDDFGEDEYFVKDPRGFVAVLSAMLAEIKQAGNVEILLNQNVTEVHYAPGDVKVLATDVSSGASKEWAADAVVSSVSIGVYKNKIIKFVPELPTWKTTALMQYDMATFTKVFVAYPKDATFMPDVKLFALTNPKRGYYPEWLTWGTTDTHRILMGYVVGEEGLRVEDLAPETVKDEVEQVFKNAYGSAHPGANFRPAEVMVTDWGKNPRFMGSYSLLGPHAMQNSSWGDLKEPLSGTTDRSAAKTLYFTGEAQDVDYSGFVHGALNSGAATAGQILGTSITFVQK